MINHSLGRIQPLLLIDSGSFCISTTTSHYPLGG